MGSDMKREELEAFGKAMLGMAEDGPRPFSIGVPLGRGRQPESSTTRAPRDEEIVLSSTSEEALFGAATLLAIQARAAKKQKAEEEPVEVPPKPRDQMTSRELLAEAEEAGKRADATFRAICRRAGVDPDAPPPPPPAPVDDRKTMLDRAVAAERERADEKAARKERKQREKLGQRLDKLVGRGAFSK